MSRAGPGPFGGALGASGPGSRKGAHRNAPESEPAAPSARAHDTGATWLFWRLGGGCARAHTRHFELHQSTSAPADRRPAAASIVSCHMRQFVFPLLVIGHRHHTGAPVSAPDRSRTVKKQGQQQIWPARAIGTSHRQHAPSANLSWPVAQLNQFASGQRAAHQFIIIVVRAFHFCLDSTRALGAAPRRRRRVRPAQRASRASLRRCTRAPG